MSQTTPRIGLPLLQPAQAQKHVTHNTALQQLDAVVQLSLNGFSETVPPADPEAGDCHGLGAGATGAWAGHDGTVALWDGTGWLFLPPREGWRAWGQAEGELRLWQDEGWRAEPLQPQGAERMGINTGADDVNRLAVASEASLLTHAGAGHQLKINKAGATDTAALLFQSNWTGHAEMGLAGENGWSLKVSPDGGSWTTALQVDPATGLASGAAVQQGAGDVTPGRLMRADYGYGPGNLLGSVGQSDGQPTGAVIERGSTANGQYVRFADGTQICTHQVTAGSITSYGTGTWGDPYRSPSVNWTYPAAFASGSQPTLIASACLSAATPTGGGRRALLVAPSSDIYPTIAYSIIVHRQGTDTSPDSPVLHLTAFGLWV